MYLLLAIIMLWIVNMQIFMHMHKHADMRMIGLFFPDWRHWQRNSWLSSFPPADWTKVVWGWISLSFYLLWALESLFIPLIKFSTFQGWRWGAVQRCFPSFQQGRWRYFLDCRFTMYIWNQLNILQERWRYFPTFSWIADVHCKRTMKVFSCIFLDCRYIESWNKNVFQAAFQPEKWSALWATFQESHSLVSSRWSQRWAKE